MGYIKHDTVVVVGWGKGLEKAHEYSKEILSDLTSQIMHGYNEYNSFFVAPDGSKEGWEHSDIHNEKRKKLCDFIDKLAYDDGSNAVQFILVSIDEDNEAEIERKNA